MQHCASTDKPYRETSYVTGMSRLWLPGHVLVMTSSNSRSQLGQYRMRTSMALLASVLLGNRPWERQGSGSWGQHCWVALGPIRTSTEPLPTAKERDTPGSHCHLFPVKHSPKPPPPSHSRCVVYVRWLPAI